MTLTDFTHLEHILTRIDCETDLSKWAELNWEFHAALYAPAQMPLLIQTVREFHNNVVRFMVYYIREAQLIESQRQHRALVALCQQGAIDAACALLQDHLQEPAVRFAGRLSQE
jgi:DNA-binding GntR family transcriptional regulator